MNRQSSLHTFHIPVMGLAFTVDTPAKVARYGISSVISIIEDTLIERMRKHYYGKINKPYHPIDTSEFDYRAKRITDYLNLLNNIVNKQIEKLKTSTFEAGSELAQYFEMLPDSSLLKKMYQQMQEMTDRYERKKLEQQLINEVRPGNIDVNIMTKLDNERYHSDGSIIEDGSDAVAALRGYANSELCSSIIFSAGMNPRLFNYMERLDVFTEMENNQFIKKIVIKVSDHRSAIIQGKYLAKKGLWVSEFRIESGLNCGGHAFASEGYMLGPILEEFKNKRQALTEELFGIYCKALEAKGKALPAICPGIKVTVQGGIGTYEEDQYLCNTYDVDATGWGSPFMLVPEAVLVDDETLQLLAKATEDDIVLSKNSPLGVPFNFLKGASGEKQKYQQAEEGHPGSACTEKFLQSNFEFTEKAICTASANYIRKKLQQLKDANLNADEHAAQVANVLTKECLCVGLSNAAILKCKLPPISKAFMGVTVCPGPNLAYFDKIVSLKEMVDHIYGRTNLLREGHHRPHVFVKELSIYIAYLKEDLAKYADLTNVRQVKYYKSFCKNMLDAVAYYQIHSDAINTSSPDKAREQFDAGLKQAKTEIEQILSVL